MRKQNFFGFVLLVLMCVLSMVSCETFADQCQAEHNKIRNIYGVPPLTSNPRLQSAAQKRADELANGVQSTKPVVVGENKVTSNSSSIESVIDTWASESQFFNFGSPSFSPQTQHFTQLVWKSTKVIGCGIAQKEGKFFVVVFYFPEGNNNKNGGFPGNVPKPPFDPIL